MIDGFKGLHRELGGLYTLASLQVLDCRNRLPLTKQYSEGSRTFNPDEVKRFRVEVETRRANKGARK